MGNNAKTTEFLKECMADALIRSMQQKPLAKITVDEISLAAGVHRSTWFRNFNSKNEAITYKLMRLWHHWADEHNLAVRNRYSADNAFDFFQFNYENRHILEIIYKADLQPSLYDAFYHIMMPQYGTNAEECYQSRFFSYGLFGLLDEWIKRGFHETPEEMAALFLKMMNEKK